MNMENISKVTSYTSANALPVKVFTDKELLHSMMDEKKIIPVHVQLVPTNRCNLACKYCSFKESDRTQQLSKEDLDGIVDMCKSLGTKGITITGGGEPLLHPQINELIENIYSKGMKVGLVSNGKQLDKLKPENINLLTWYRISFDTNRKLDDTFINNLDRVTAVNKSCDMAFSYVVSSKTDGQDLRRLVEYANTHNFSHVRVVEDIFNPGISSMEEVRELLKGINTDLVVFQGKKEHVRGEKDCLISLVKPFIAADGYIYPCCGITYAHNDELKVEPKSMRMGHWSELTDIVNNQKNFNGLGCDKCYYPEYNIVLKAIGGDIKHKEFI
jgi:MoaA/NifB/PqqE/SkfB family radical SAM enzyme